jgi:hypothetical protein
MESLAATVAAIMATIVVTGPLSLFLSSSKVQAATAGKPAANAIRRSVSTFSATIGILFAAQLIFGDVPITASILALACINMNIFAIKNEYFKHIR